MTVHVKSEWDGTMVKLFDLNGTMVEEFYATSASVAFEKLGEWVDDLREEAEAS